MNHTLALKVRKSGILFVILNSQFKMARNYFRIQAPK